MIISRRTALQAAAVVPLMGSVAGQQRVAMYGLIGRIKAYTGKRDDLAAILLESISGAPGCLSYIVAKDPKDPDSLWVTEVWESEADHQSIARVANHQRRHYKGPPAHRLV